LSNSASNVAKFTGKERDAESSGLAPVDQLPPVFATATLKPKLIF